MQLAQPVNQLSPRVFRNSLMVRDVVPQASTLAFLRSEVAEVLLEVVRHHLGVRKGGFWLEGFESRHEMGGVAH